MHLIGLGVLAFAVSGAAFHILPVMLRNGRPRSIAWIALPCLWCGPILAEGVATFDDRIIHPSLVVVATGYVLVALQTGALLVRAPHTRLLLTSRVGIALSTLSAAVALSLGARLAIDGWRPLWGIDHGHLIVLHLTIAALGWLTLLIVSVGRTLAPMLALAPSEKQRRLPAVELLLAVGVASAMLGVALDRRDITFVALIVTVSSLVGFAAIVVRAARRNRLDFPEAPIVHFLVGLLFLAQAITAAALVLQHGPSPHLLAYYVITLIVGWASAVTIGHAGKLLALSAWTWWPPGPRPKQHALYPRRIWLGEALLLSVGVQTVAVGVLVARGDVVRSGAVAVVASAVLALLGAAVTMLKSATLVRTPKR